MPDTPTFVVNDRRKFTSEGDLRHDLPAEEAKSPSPVPQDTLAGPQLVEEALTPPATTAELSDLPEAGAISELYPDHTAPIDSEDALDSDDSMEAFPDDPSLPAGPTAEQSAEAARAYEATVDRLDTAMRAANPGGERMPDMTFERLVQSLYTQALMLLGGATEPGETPRVDILGARQTIDMLSVVAAKTRNNLAPAESKLLDSALFDLHMGFLEITQALARQAAQRQPAPGGLPPLGAAGGPRIVR